MLAPDSRTHSSTALRTHLDDEAAERRREVIVVKLREMLFGAEVHRGARGPAQDARLTPLGQALLRLIQADKSLGDFGTWRLDGYSAKAWDKVLDGERGLEAREQLEVAHTLMSSAHEPMLRCALRPLLPLVGPETLAETLWGSVDAGHYFPLLHAADRAATAVAPPTTSVGWDHITLRGHAAEDIVDPFTTGLRDMLKPAPRRGESVHDAKGGLSIDVDSPDGPLGLVLFRSLSDFKRLPEGRKRHWRLGVAVYCPQVCKKAVAFLRVGLRDRSASTATNIALHITGTGCRRGLGPALAHALFTPFVAAQSISFGRCDLRVDLIDRPYSQLVVFDKRAKGISSAKAYNTTSDHWRAPVNHWVGTGVVLGGRNLSCCVYDKSGRIAGGRDHNGEPALPHLAKGAIATRVELRALAHRRKYAPDSTATVDGMLTEFGYFAVADLALADHDCAVSTWLLPFAKRGPLLKMPKKAVLKRQVILGPDESMSKRRRAVDGVVDVPFPRTFAGDEERVPTKVGAWDVIFAYLNRLDRLPKRQREWTRTLYEWIRAEVERIAKKTPIDLAQMAGAHREELIAELDSMTVPAPIPRWFRERVVHHYVRQERPRTHEPVSGSIWRNR